MGGMAWGGMLASPVVPNICKNAKPAFNKIQQLALWQSFWEPLLSK